MPFSTDSADKEIKERLQALTAAVRKIENARQKGEKHLSDITVIENKVFKQGHLSSTIQQELRSIYGTTINDASVEEELLRKALDEIREIRDIFHTKRMEANISSANIHRSAQMKMIQQAAEMLPLYVSKVSKVNVRPPPLCGAVPADPDYVAKPGDMVAARVKNKEGKELNWILAEVVSYNPQTEKYEVEDIDDKEDPRRVPRFHLRRKVIVPLPLMRANPETDPLGLFPKNTEVMALYPQTTCFYKAVVNDLPQTAADYYELLFEDNEYPDNFAPPLKVAQRYVIDFRLTKLKV